MNPIRQRVIETPPHTLFADTELAEITATLRYMGFIDGDEIKDVSDRPPEGVYLIRLRLGQYQYVFLSSYEGAFCEAVIHVYREPFNGRAKVRQVPLYANIVRSLEKILDAVETVYTPPTKP